MHRLFVLLLPICLLSITEGIRVTTRELFFYFSLDFSIEIHLKSDLLSKMPWKKENKEHFLQATARSRASAETAGMVDIHTTDARARWAYFWFGLPFPFLCFRSSFIFFLQIWFSPRKSPVNQWNNCRPVKAPNWENIVFFATRPPVLFFGWLSCIYRSSETHFNSISEAKWFFSFHRCIFRPTVSRAKTAAAAASAVLTQRLSRLFSQASRVSRLIFDLYFLIFELLLISFIPVIWSLFFTLWSLILASHRYAFAPS